MTSTHYLDKRWCLNCEKPVRVAPNLESYGPLWVWYHERDDDHLEKSFTSKELWLHRRWCTPPEYPGDLAGFVGIAAEPNQIVSDEEAEEYLGELDDLEHELNYLAVD